MSKVRLATLLWSNPTFADTLLNLLSTTVMRTALLAMSLVIAVKSTWAKLALAAAFASAFSAAVFRARAVLAELAALLSLEDAAFALAAAAKALTAAAFALAAALLSLDRAAAAALLAVPACPEAVFADPTALFALVDSLFSSTVTRLARFASSASVQ